MARCSSPTSLCPGELQYACTYCHVAFFWESGGDITDPTINCSRQTAAESGLDTCSPSATCPQYFLLSGVSGGLIRNSPSCPEGWPSVGGGPGLCGCTGLLSLFCACYKNNGIANLRTIAAENLAEAMQLLQMLGYTNISIYAKTIGQSCVNTEPSGACCSGATGFETCSIRSQCGCAGLDNSTFYKDKACSEVECGPSKRCCHCEWCCNITGAMTETACTSSGGTVQSGRCPSSGPCSPASCKPCQRTDFWPVKSTAYPALRPASGSAFVRAFDTPNTNDDEPLRVYGKTAKVAGRNYAAPYMCNRYNWRLGNQQVSKCRANRGTPTRNYLRATCAYREPCNEKPSPCVR